MAEITLAPSTFDTSAQSPHHRRRHPRVVRGLGRRSVIPLARAQPVQHVERVQVGQGGRHLEPTDGDGQQVADERQLGRGWEGRCSVGRGVEERGRRG